MHNNLNNFIRENRAAFDEELPSENTWKNIEASFPEKKKKKTVIAPLYKWSMAAAAMLIIATGVYFNIQKQPGEQTIPVVANTENMPSAYTLQLNQFVKLIDTKQEELKTLAADRPELYRKFTTAINQLDSSYNTLKNQLSATPNQEMLLEAMIQNLQLQLQVLNQQLNIINQIKESNKNSHEKNDQKI